MSEKILFFERSIYDIFAENNRRILEELGSLSCEKLIHEDIKELSEKVYQNHKMANISLEIERTRVLEHNSKYMKVGIPVNEGKELLEARPTNEYGSVHPVGLLENGMITKVFSLHRNMERTKQSIRTWKQIMDVYSNNLNEDIIHYHKHLLKDIEDRIKELREGCMDLDERLKGLSIELNLEWS